MSEAGQTGASVRRIDALTGRGACLRPPWTSEARIRQMCTACGDCIKACPEAILVSGPAGTPAVRFDDGACTFCGACAEACDEDVFAKTDDQAWALTAAIGGNCLLNAGITCQSCVDACNDGAIRFDMRAGPVGAVGIVSENCTGCGACVSVCPARAIDIRHPQEAA